MKKFKCEVIEAYEYEIEIDDDVWTDEAIQEWSKSFYDAEDIHDFVEHLAKMKPGYESGEFIEGFGIPKIDGKVPFVWDDPDGKTVSKEININIIDENCYVDCEEIL